MYCSTHEIALYPGTGAGARRARHDNVVNVPLRAGDGSHEFREGGIRGRIVPRSRRFAPTTSSSRAGFDAHLRDPLANLNLLEADFAGRRRS